MAAFCVEVADRAGVCYGVERALRMARDAGLAATGRVHTQGPLIHNPNVVRLPVSMWPIPSMTLKAARLSCAPLASSPKSCEKRATAASRSSMPPART